MNETKATFYFLKDSVYSIFQYNRPHTIFGKSFNNFFLLNPYSWNVELVTSIFNYLNIIFGLLHTVGERHFLKILFAVEFRLCIEMPQLTVITDHYSLEWLFNIVHRTDKNHLVQDSLCRVVSIIDRLNVPNALADKWYVPMLRKVITSFLKYPFWRLQRGKTLFQKKNCTVHRIV